MDTKSKILKGVIAFHLPFQQIAIFSPQVLKVQAQEEKV